MKKIFLLGFVFLLFSTAVVVVFVSPLMSHWIHPTQQSEPFPTTWIAAAIAIIAIGGVAFLVYFAKVKKTNGKAETPTMRAQGENWVSFTHE